MKTKAVSFLVIFLLVFSALFSLSACSGNASNEPVVLQGEWKQVNGNTEETWHEAVIENEEITVYWVMDEGDTKSLYWAGTFAAPDSSEEPYSWDSENDHDQTGPALLASGDDTKTFTYENGELSYSASAMGTTTTVRLKKKD